MGLFSILFGGGEANNRVKELLDQGAIIIDVRTPAEFSMGSIDGSRNIPLNTITRKVDEIKKLKKPVVLCCASGARSGQATSILQRHGITCENGGGWTQVRRLID